MKAVKAFVSALTKMGYRNVKKSPSGQWCGVFSYAFTFGLVVGLTDDCYERRYCYEHQGDALAALLAWNGVDHPSGPWIKCKGAGIDMLNPDYFKTPCLIS